MSKYQTVNPATGELVEEFATATDAEIEVAISAAHDAYAQWKRTPIEQRAALMGRAAELMRERKTQFAELITLEMGKLPAEAEGEVDLSADILAYYADNGPRILADETLHPASGGDAIVVSEPIGPLVGVMPWNFPQYQIARFAGPNLVAGNTILLKHAPSCPQSALAFEQLITDAGFPSGAYTNIFATNEQIQDILADGRIAGASVTGSERAGSAVAEGAGDHLKKVVLEMGGSDPYIVLDTSDMQKTVATAVNGRMTNSGQSCIASKRLIVPEARYDEFVGELTDQMSALRTGDPGDEGTDVAPLHEEKAAQDLVEQIDDAVSKGATLRTGGHRIDRRGAFVEPTVLTDVTRDMRAFSEELFGPVAVVYSVADEDEAVALANESSFGLGGSVVSDDIDHAREVARRVETGMVWINKATWTEPDLPFGGTKRSGVGTELGADGIQQFLNKKLIRA
ncbi:MAG: NAD-dependent succinate-semialdehyde dehydrogenase [Tomitella sp.]|nr:NAD-dependent succinate-semialdehyde dehydrogenase [Tomitella sp.]